MGSTVSLGGQTAYLANCAKQMQKGWKKHATLKCAKTPETSSQTFPVILKTSIEELQSPLRWLSHFWRKQLQYALDFSLTIAGNASSKVRKPYDLLRRTCWVLVLRKARNTRDCWQNAKTVQNTSFWRPAESHEKIEIILEMLTHSQRWARHRCYPFSSQKWKREPSKNPEGRHLSGLSSHSWCR